MLVSRRAFLARALAALSSPAAAWLPSIANSAETKRLKVTGCKTLVVDNVSPYYGMKQWLFIQLTTNEGLIGLGERPAAAMINLKSQIELIHGLCERYVIGESPFDVERIWQRAYGSAHDYRNPGLFGTPALSAIEMACWDLMGKALQLPVYNLLGGRYHERLRAYSYLDIHGAWEQPAVAGERAAKLVERGITVCKIDPFFYDPFNAASMGGARDFPLESIRRAAKIFRSIRDAVGDRLEIGIGTHGQFSTAGAIRVASLLEEFNPFFFEEPVPPENVNEMARVAAHTTIPIATGERLVTKYEFAEVLERRAAQIMQLDVGQCGGILEAKKIAALAEAHYATIAPHMYCGPVAAAAAVQLDACSPGFLVQEFNATPLHEEILVEPLKIHQGYITPPARPGLGVELDDKVVRRQLSP